MTFSLMSPAQIVHVEEVSLGKRTYTVTVVRIAGGLAARWYCDCGEVVALTTPHLTIEDAIQHAKQDLSQHHNTQHSANAQD
jgi:hypothetical protein